ncbi:CPBP family intramembrane metalloprotease [bacterium]|nr:CPBP family intramembrane metalloprotease [bacterium]
MNKKRKEFKRQNLSQSLNSSPWAVLGELVGVLFLIGLIFAAAYLTGSAFLALLTVVGAWLAVWLTLWLRGRGWEEFGFQIPKSWGQILLVAVGGTLLIHMLMSFILKPFITQLTGESVDISRFDPVRGNLVYLLMGLSVVWTLAAFGEEMVFRGYLLNRIADLFKNRYTGWAVGLIVSSIVFGLGHLYQGISGAILAGFFGMVFALVYLVSGRNLWVPILLHGFYDTSAFLILYFSLDKTVL